MPETYNVFRAFIASPGDVAAERQLAEETIASVNKGVRDTLAVTIDTRKWEHMPPEVPDLPEEKLQDKLNKEVERCHFFVLILYKRYGTIQPGYAISNTEREIDTILKIHERKPKLRILSYFRDLETNADPGGQEEKVRELRKRLERIGVPYRTYRDPIEFTKYLTHDLYDVLLRIKLSPFKKQALNRFWHFGQTTRPNQPRVAIVYPPVDRHILTAGSDPEYWLKKLANLIALEDYKALQKIESNITLIGCINYRVYPYTNPPADLPWMNRVWLCLPRNKLGLKELAKHQNVRFQFPESATRSSSILWRRTTGRRISVKSPMAAYLQKQRSKMEISGEWHGQLGRIVAKDFAVLARVRRNAVGDDEPLWDYFLGGIRGLGTWGSAWFIDKEYKQFQQYGEDDNIEMLLEVTFQDGRILEVSNVSECSQQYFNKANDPVNIEKNIAAYQG